VLRLPAEALRRGGDVTAEAVASVAVTDGQAGARAADLSPDGSLVVAEGLRTTSVWLRGPAQSVGEGLTAEPAAPCTADLGSGEALAVSLDGGSIWTLDEGVGKPLRRFAVTP
jgi:hypothetical protein